MSNVQPGYKQTEVGVIPEDWEVNPLCNVAEIRSGIAKNSNVSVSDPVFVHYLRVANVQDGFLDLKEVSKINVVRSDLNRYAVLPGDVLMNEGGDLDKIGRGSIWRGEFSPCVHQNHVFVVRCRSTISPEYLNIWTGAQPSRRYFLVAGKQTTNLATINKTALGQLPVAIPPKAEQEAIAEAMSDTDALIESLEQLITKKRHLKQGAMQELLTGKMRLPGFRGEWRKATLDEICTFENGDRGKNYPSAAAFVGDGFPFVNAGHLNDGHINFGEMDYITKNSFDLLGGGKFMPGDVLFCLRGSLGKFGIVDQNVPSGAIASSLVIVRNKPAYISLKYLACYFASAYCAQMIERWSGGAAQPNLGVQDLARFSIPLPSLSEQETIATILSDMDTEITGLETKLSKTRQLKQGMMHNLLTGRIRLI